MLKEEHYQKNTHATTHTHVKGAVEIEGSFYYGHTPQPKNLFLTIRLTENELTALTDLAERYNTTKTAMIKALLKNLLPG